MVCIAKGVLGDLPRVIPTEVIHVHEKTHQLRDADRGVRIVQLHRPLEMKFLERSLANAMDTDHVLQGTGDEEVLLLEAKALALRCIVARIKHLRDRLRQELFTNSTHVITGIEGLKIKRLNRLRLPQTKAIYRSGLIAGDWRVVGYSPYTLCWFP